MSIIDYCVLLFLDYCALVREAHLRDEDRMQQPILLRGQQAQVRRFHRHRQFFPCSVKKAHINPNMLKNNKK